MRQKLFTFMKWLLVITLLYIGVSYTFAFWFVTDHGLPPHLMDQCHEDYKISFTRFVKRRWVSRKLVEPPILIIGSSVHAQSSGETGDKGPSPLPLPGQWQFSLVQVKANWPFYLPYFAATGTNHHFRVGTRWDDVDHYFTLFSIAWRRTERLQ